MDVVSAYPENLPEYFRILFQFEGHPDYMIEIPYSNAVLKSMSLLHPNGDPIVVTPFYMHGERVHTICTLNGDVERLEL